MRGKGILTRNLNANALKACIDVEKEEMNIFEEIFHNELLDAIRHVENDLNQDDIDTIDVLARAGISKKRKLCLQGHINYDVRSNRKICYRSHCKEKLLANEEVKKDAILNEEQVKKSFSEKEKVRAKMYYDVPNVIPEYKPKELAVKATAVNPNTSERIARVLDDIIQSADMKNRYSVKTVISKTMLLKS